ncbi:hypothetical protein [Flavobacterium suncheonense]|uniref:Lipoprotein n=1 Tax=Flavobacterium suncheonense GH29-5 = DSM 17707 TaxID=1121899 RepID=A0A0A2MMT5_9FLAO|nr:hypothetical protein [Flavobacterium suncheonense]KGO89590.1 hypothetical protein Q764_07415 [Flavobacterium suncheonense GH29-5 = DSM 17707]
MRREILLGLLFLSLAACRKNANEPEKTEETTTTEAAAESVHEAKEVTLDNGQLWTANPETTEGIKNMQKIISERQQETTGSDLKAALENEFQMIFEKCTMKGEAHNQLHNYLLPLKMKLNQLDGTNDEEVISEIDTYLKEYSNYFQ